jgi:eukaryotic-like serine/threonine-protein kinase
LHKLGTGGFGAVYQAEDTQLGGRLVAVKEMSAQSGLSAQENSEATEAFKKEALLLAELLHPNLARIYDHFSEDGRWYLAMDYIEGETLEAYLEKQQGGSLPLSETLEMGLQLCDVLDYLHTRQPPIIFRDLKPLNIMRTASGHLYLIDFGIARHFKPGQMKDTVAFGSPGYAAPEQYGKTQTTPRSDIYSLGATLHQMLTGIDPSLNPFRFSLLRLPAGKPTPRALAVLVARMVEMDEIKRPTRMSAVKMELQEIAARVANGSFAIVKSSTAAPIATSPLPPVSTPIPTPPAPPVNIGTLRCLHEGKHDKVRALSWSPDSKLLVSAGNGNIIDVWDAENGQTVRSYRNHGGSIRMALWSPDGKYIASASEDKTVQVWEANSGKTRQIYRGHTHLVTGLSWAPDSQRIVSSSVDKSVQVWDIRTGHTSVTYTRHRDVVYRAAWSPDGEYVASGSYDNAVRVWEAMSGKHLFTYEGHSALIFALGWSPDGQFLASGSYDTTVQVWNAFDGRTITTYGGHTGQVQSLSWSPDGTRIVSCGGSSVARIWDAASGSDLFTYRGHETPPTLQPIDPALRPLPGQVAPVSGQLHRYTSDHPMEVSAVAWSPDGQWIASGGTYDAMRVWHAN